MRRPVSIFALYQQIGQQIADKIASEPDSFILCTPTEQLVEYYFNNHHHTPREQKASR